MDTMKNAIEEITSDCGQQVLQILNYVKVNSDSPPTPQIIATTYTCMRSYIIASCHLPLPQGFGLCFLKCASVQTFITNFVEDSP